MLEGSDRIARIGNRTNGTSDQTANDHHQSNISSNQTTNISQQKDVFDYQTSNTGCSEESSATGPPTFVSSMASQAIELPTPIVDEASPTTKPLEWSLQTLDRQYRS